MPPIDPLAEDLCLLSDLLNRLPKRPSPTVVWRWTNKGTRGTRLRTLKICGHNHTTETEFRRFIAAIQDPEPPDSESVDHNAVEEQLRAAGYMD